jgi:DNA-directed RNA polymerase subunit L
MTNKATPDFGIKVLNFRKAHNFQTSKLEIEFSGSLSSAIIANTIRRVAQDDIPSYAFYHRQIEFNNSIFNNDLIKNRLLHLPIYDVKCDLHYLNPKYWKNMDIVDITQKREKHEKEQLIEAIVNVHNNTNDNVLVTTRDVIYVVDGEKSEYPVRNKDNPILLIELRPNETFKCYLKAFLGVGEKNSAWTVCNSYYNEVKKNNIIFKIESHGQYTELDILEKACKYIISKLEAIRSEIQRLVDDKQVDDGQTIIFELVDENETIGHLINDALQDHENILFAGVSQPDRLVKTIKFKISSIDKSISPIDCLFDVIDDRVKLFEYMQKEFKKIKV